VVVLAAALSFLCLERSAHVSVLDSVLCLHPTPHDECIFGWVSGEWFELILLFGLVIGVVCIAGFNYAVRI
jgi:hypothetical protein